MPDAISEKGSPKRPSGVAAYLAAVLAHRWLPFWLALLAIVMTVPAIWHGFMLDDYLWRARLLDPSLLDARLLDTGWVHPGSSRLPQVLPNLFDILRPGEGIERLMESGMAPWWTSDTVSLSFFQPLTALTYWADYALWPNSPKLMHAQNILWFAAAIMAVTVLYRSLLTPPWIAGLAALLYAIDESFYNPVAWISNRNMLTALFFGSLAILFHHKWRSSQSRIAALLSPVFLLCCLLSKEFGVSVLAYYVAYACFVEKAGWIRRSLSLVPSLALAAIWKFAYSTLGYGVSNMGLYVDPIVEPARFLAALLARGPILLFAQWSLLPSAVHNFLTPSLQGLVWWVAAAYLAILFAVMLPLLRRDRMARFWSIGMFLCILPATCLSFTEDRLLIFAGIGAMGLTAQFVSGVFEKASWLPHRRVMRIAAQSLCLVLILTHVAGACAGRFIRPYYVEVFKRSFFDPSLRVGADPELENQDLIVLNAPNPSYFFYFPFVRFQQGAPIPRVTRILAPAFGPILVARTGDRDLVLRSLSGSLLSVGEPTCLPPANSIIRYMHDVYGYRKGIHIFRNEPCGMEPGERITLHNLEIVVLRVGEDGCPKEASFRFALSLNDPSFRWLKWDWQTMSYRPFKVPRVGESLVVAGIFSGSVSFNPSDTNVLSNQ